MRLAKTYRSGNVFLAGDSAHVHSTTGGQGMNCCMQDAYNLGWKLALVVQGKAPAKLLDTYVTERRPIAEQVIWAASSLHEIFMGHGKDIAERATKIKDQAFLDAIVSRCSGLSYTYRDYVPKGEGLAEIAGPAVGDRAPDADLGGGSALYDFTRHTHFTLLLLEASADRQPARAELLRHVTKRFHGLVEAHVVSPSPAVAKAVRQRRARSPVPVASRRLYRLPLSRERSRAARGASRGYAFRLIPAPARAGIAAARR